jgi:hypothetical protein
MITIRQIERLFNDQQWGKLAHELTQNRPETPLSAWPMREAHPGMLEHHRIKATDHVRQAACGFATRQRKFVSPNFPNLPHKIKTSSATLPPSLIGVVPVAALAIIRLDELTQAAHPLYRRLLNVILTAQQKDGGWGDLLVTALCLRALIAGNGSGVAISAGLAYLCNLQKSEGAWPHDPIRRLPADGYTTAFILHQLGEFSLFRSAVRFDDAITWFSQHHPELDGETRRLWQHAAMRCRLATTHRPAPLFAPRPAA